MNLLFYHDDVMTWEYFPHYWPFVTEIRKAAKGEQCGALVFPCCLLTVQQAVGAIDLGCRLATVMGWGRCWWYMICSIVKQSWTVGQWAGGRGAHWLFGCKNCQLLCVMCRGTSLWCPPQVVRREGGNAGGLKPEFVPIIWYFFVDPKCAKPFL